MLEVGRLDSYRGEGVVFDVAPVNITGNFLATDEVKFLAKRDIRSADPPEVSINAVFNSATSFRVTVPISAIPSLPDEVVEFAWMVTWKRGAADPVVLRAGDWWVHPSAKKA